MSRHRWLGERRNQSPENLARRAQYAYEGATEAPEEEIEFRRAPARGGSSSMKALLAALGVTATLATGYVTLANRQATVQSERSDSGMWRRLGEIDAQVKQYVFQADEQHRSTQRELQEIRERLKTLESESKDANRKLDLLVYESNRRRQIGSNVPRPPAIALAPLPQAFQGSDEGGQR